MHSLLLTRFLPHPSHEHAILYPQIFLKTPNCKRQYGTKISLLTFSRVTEFDLKEMWATRLNPYPLNPGD